MRGNIAAEVIFHMNNIIKICAQTDPEGTWTTWQPWEECTQSCGGGTQTRSRQCVSFIDPEITDDTCVGHVSKNRTCNTMPCPGIASFYHQNLL